MQPRRVRRQSFDGGDFPAVRLHGQHQAGAHRAAVAQHRACAAHTVLAADVRAGHSKLVAQEISQQHARLGLGFDSATVEREAHAVTLLGAQEHRRASSMVARPMRRTSSRR